MIIDYSTNDFIATNNASIFYDKPTQMSKWQVPSDFY